MARSPNLEGSIDYWTDWMPEEEGYLPTEVGYWMTED